ncbi:hypothetical protein NX059_001256 [Plenodomus lindquistii]|nr:hypothetical protein NX059_001256 [Plenodomus lindquistii]
MHIIPWAGLVLLASAEAAQAATDKQTGIVEVDLVFPRNETYAPTQIMPVVFGFQNPELAPFVATSLAWTLFDDMSNNGTGRVDDGSFDLRWTNFSSSNGSTYYRYHSAVIPELKKEGLWTLNWRLVWWNCTGESSPHSNTSSWYVSFATKSGAEEMDVEVSGEGCSPNQGFAFNITDTHKTTPRYYKRDWAGGDRCAELAPSLPTPDSCRNDVSPAAASSISASLFSQLCSSDRDVPVVDCPAEENGAPRTIVGSVVGLMVVLGALSRFLN